MNTPAPDLALRAPTTRPLRGESSVERAIRAAATALRRWRERVAEARRAREAAALLLGMSDRDLRDIGLTRDELHRLFRDGRL